VRIRQFGTPLEILMAIRLHLLLRSPDHQHALEIDGEITDAVRTDYAHHCGALACRRMLAGTA
jgi:hypothetical protein